jgi:hypothetical protein
MIKEGRYYETAGLKPLDLILFKGTEFVSKSLIKIMKTRIKHVDNKEIDDFSHVGMIITKELIDLPELVSGKLYIFEAIYSGKMTDGVKNIYNKSFFGTQIRDFDAVMLNNDKHSNVQIAVVPIKNNPLYGPDAEKVKRRFKVAFEKYNNARFEGNVFSMLGALYPKFRCIRNFTEEVFERKRWMFCSELCAQVYKDIGVLKEDAEPRNVVPLDFIGFDQDGDITKGIFDKHFLITNFPKSRSPFSSPQTPRYSKI